MVNESEIYGCHCTKIIIYPEKMLRIYYDHWWWNVTDGATVIEWVANFRQKFCNVLVIEHKCSDSLPIDWALNYKRESTKNPRYNQLHTNNLWKSLSSPFLSNIFLLTNLSNEGGLVDWLTPHRRVTLPPSSFCKFSIYRDNPIHNIVHLLRRGAQLLVFSIINGIYHQLTLFSLISLQIGGLKLDGPREKTIGPTIISSIFFLIFTLPFSILLIFTPTNQTLSDAYIILLYHNLENTKSKTRKQREESLP